MKEPNISRQEALDILGQKPSLVQQDGSITNQIRQYSDQQKAMLDIYKKERHQILDMRKHWSMWILLSILVLVTFDMFIIFSIGLGWLKFEGAIIPVFLTESVIKIFGLAYVVVRFLFNSKEEENGKGEIIPE